MDTKIAAVGSAPEVALPANNATPSSAPQKAVVEAANAPAPAVGPEPVDTRLVIDRDPSSGMYVYKTVNRLTGEIIQQLPRDAVLRMRNQPAYSAGDVVSTKA